MKATIEQARAVANTLISDRQWLIGECIGWCIGYNDEDGFFIEVRVRPGVQSSLPSHRNGVRIVVVEGDIPKAL